MTNQLMLKGALQFRAITRVPMIWSDPANREKNVSQALASTIDLSASILDRAGLAPYFGMQGQSFLDCLASDAEHRDGLFVGFNDGGPRIGFESPARVRSIITQDWRLTHYAGEDWGELYDLKADPQETNNLWGDPSAATAQAALSLKLIDSLTGQMDESPRADRMA